MWGALAAAVVLGSSSAPATQPSRIVFASSRTTVSQLYSVEPSGRGLAQLTFGAGDWLAPLPSPDGRFVAAFRGNELWLMRGDGRDARLLAQAGQAIFDSPSWSRDSRRLAFAKDGAIWTIAAARGPPRQVTHGVGDSEPTFSPDGRSIAFLRPDSYGDGDMLVVRRRGRERVVTHEVSGRPAWSPDGRWIAVIAARSLTIELVRPSSGAHKVVVNDCGCALTGGAWSPDSRRLAYVNGEGIYVVERSGRRWRQRLLAAPPGQGFAWSPRGKAIGFATDSGVEIVSLAGGVRTLVPFRPHEALWGVGWSWAATDLAYQKPEEVLFLVEVSPRELEARVPIQQLSADGDGVAYFLCPHIFGTWRPGEGQPLFPGRTTLLACRPPENEFVNYVSDLALAGDRLAYLTSVAANSVWTRLMLTTFNPCCESEGGTIVENGAHYDWRPALDDVVGAGTTIVYGSRAGLDTSTQGPETIWRLDDYKPVQITSDAEDLQPLAVGEGRIVARRPDGSLELIDLEGGVLRTLDVHALGAVLAGGDLVVHVAGELRDYSASTGELRYVWPLPDVPSLTLDDAARGVVVYTLDGVVHLLRLSSGADVTVPGATAAELTDAGLFCAYRGEDPWPGRIRFVPFDELPL